MKKKFAVMLTMVLCVAFAFSGCSLFTQDYNKYLARPVATIDYIATAGTPHKITITKEELLQAYNRYGSTLSENGRTGQDAIDYLVDYIINQKVILNEVKDLIANGTITLTDEEKAENYNEVWNNTFDAVVNLLEDYEEDVIDDLDLANPAETEEEEEEDTKSYKPYQPKATIEQDENGYYIQLKDYSTTESRTHTFKENQEDTIAEIIAELNKKIGVVSIDKKTGSDGVLVEAKNRYISSLKDYEKGKNLSTDVKEIWQREITRLFKQMLDNKNINIYMEYLQNGTDRSIVTINDVFNYLQGQMKFSYTKYSMNTETYKTDILSSRSSMYYFLNDSSLGKYFNVSHILVKFSDEQKTDLANLNTALENGLDIQSYNAQKKIIVDGTKVKLNGEVQDMTIGTLFTQIANAMTGKDDAKKMEVFREYMYNYSEDTGTFNAEYDYIVGTDDSKMVKSFTNTARELYDNGNGKFGDILSNYDEYMSIPYSDVKDEYGIHLLFYIGEITNVFNIESIDSFNIVNATGADLTTNVNNIKNYKLSAFSSKTMFDLVFEKIYSDDISILEKLNVQTLRGKDKVQITKFPANISDLY